MRPIDADAIPYWEHVERCGRGRFITERIVTEKAISRMPTIDAEPVKHAEWVCDNLDDVYFCSSCGHPETYRLSAYCPECGAKMRRPWLDEKGEK